MAKPCKRRQNSVFVSVINQFLTLLVKLTGIYFRFLSLSDYNMSVTSGADSGPGTLRELIENTTVSVITVSPGVTTITLDSTITIPRNLSIYGNGVTITETVTKPNGRLFLIAFNIMVSFSDINFLHNTLNTNSQVVMGGNSILGTISSVVITSCTVRNYTNTASSLFSLANCNLIIGNTIFENNSLASPLILSTRTSIATGQFAFVIENCQFINNAARLFYYQGNIAANQDVTLLFRNLFIDGNNIPNVSDASDDIGLLGVRGPGKTVTRVTFDNITITNNSVANRGTGISIITPVAEEVIINNVRIENNFSGGNESAYTVGIRLNTTPWTGISGQSTLSNIIVRNNTGNRYAGIFIEQNVEAGQTQTVTMRNVAVVNNISPLSEIDIDGSLVLSGTGATFDLSNVVVANNSGTFTGGVYFAGTGTKLLQNVTIADNVGDSIGGIRVETGTPSPLFYNTLIADNWSNPERTDRSDGVGVVDAASSYNLITDGVTIVGITDGSQGNQIGTDLAPINALIGSVGNYGGANNFWVVPLLEGSPAINAGNNTFITPDTPFDVRGDPLVRVYDGIVDIGSFEWQPFVAPCFLADSLVKVKEIESGTVSYKRADEIKSSDYEVYNVVKEEYVPITFIAKIEGVETAYLIQAGLLGENQPFEDITLTPGHPVMIDNKPVKAKDVPGAIKVDFDRTCVYSIVCDKWCPIDVNGIGVYAWSEKKWLNHVSDACIVYTKC